MRPPGIGWALLGSELSVLFRRLRTWAMLIALAAVPVLIAVAVKLSSRPTAPGRGPLFLDRITQNGLFVAVTALVVCVPLFLPPLTVGVVAGGYHRRGRRTWEPCDTCSLPPGRADSPAAGEVCRGRRFLFRRYGHSGSVRRLAGVVLFPVGPVTLLSGDTISVGESALRSLLIAAYITVSLLGLSAIGLLISTFTDVPWAPWLPPSCSLWCPRCSTTCPQLEWLHLWLFSHHWLGFADLLRQPISWTSFGENALLQAGYIAVCGALAYAKFSNKDVLS